MSLSNWMNRHSHIVAPAAIVILMIAVLSILFYDDSEDMQRHAYRHFYDLNTGEVFIADRGLIPPIGAPSQGEGVRVYMIGCGHCDQTQIGWLEKYSDEGKVALQTTELGDAQLMQGIDTDVPQVSGLTHESAERISRGHMMPLAPTRRGEASVWVSHADDGGRVTQEAYRRCGKQLPRICDVKETELQVR